MALKHQWQGRRAEPSQRVNSLGVGTHEPRQLGDEIGVAHRRDQAVNSEVVLSLSLTSFTDPGRPRRLAPFRSGVALALEPPRVRDYAADFTLERPFDIRIRRQGHVLSDEADSPPAILGRRARLQLTDEAAKLCVVSRSAFVVATGQRFHGKVVPQERRVRELAVRGNNVAGWIVDPRVVLEHFTSRSPQPDDRR